MTQSVRSKRYVPGLVIFCGLVGLLDQFISQVEGPLMVYILAEYGLTGTPEVFAFWQGIYGIICFLVFLIAWFFDAYGRKKGILLLILALGIPAGIILFPMPLYLFLVVYSIAIMATLSNSWVLPITEEAPAKKRGLYGAIAFLIGLIPLYAFLAVPLAENLGWRWGYGIMFFFALILIIPWYFMKDTQRWLDSKEEHGHEVLKIKTAIKSLRRKDVQYILISTIAYILWTVCFTLARSWGGIYYITHQGYTSAEYANILLIAGLLTMVGALLSGILMDKLGRNATLIFGCVGSFFGAILIPTGITIFFWLAYLCMPVILGWIMVYFNEIFPTRIRSTAVGVSNTISRIGYVLGPLLGAILLSLFDNPENKMVGFWITIAILILIPLITLLSKPYETKGQVLEEIQKER